MSNKVKNTPVKSGHASIKTDNTPRVSNHRNSSSRTPNSKQPSSSAKKQRMPSRPRDTSRGHASSSRRTGSPKVPISTPPNRRHRGSGRRTPKQRMEDDSSSDESSCSSGTYRAAAAAPTARMNRVIIPIPKWKMQIMNAGDRLSNVLVYPLGGVWRLVDR